MAGRANGLQTIRSEGGLLPPDLLRRVLDPGEKLPGTLPEDYGLPRGERLNESITQSWNRLRKHWADFRSAVANLGGGEPATGVTNDKWSLPILRELGFGLLPTSPSPEIQGRTYAINRFFGPVPLHLVGCGLSLDRRAVGVRGAAAANPHGLLQEFLNRSPGHMWGIVANGLRLRLLRDNQALSRQSFLEFDLEAMFAGEVYSDFVLLWLVVHATRFTPREGERPETCWLEEWARIADEQGARALGDLRGGVERALQILGEGFTSHSRNAALRDALRNGQVSLADFHGQLLRVVYRLIFLFVAEDRLLEGRPMLHPPDDSDAARIARERYAAHYSATRLRELASKIKGSRHGDLWQQFQVLVRALSGDPIFAAARDHLALPALGSFLWDPGSTAALGDAELANHDFLEAVRELAFTRQDRVLRPVDYQNLGAEELGGVYESLLALTPQISADGARFTFAEFAGSERKTSGSYYTPDSLVQCLLDSALDPVVDQAIRGRTGGEAEKAILALKVCDPAVGSGHFLVGAAHRLARHLSRLRALAQGESEPSPLLYQHALRDVIGRCLYGVDVNPMAAELCRVSLWLEALEPGKPLSFLDHHIRVGNSLLGATPALLNGGIPDDAFKPIEGDDKEYCKELKKQNKSERKDFETGQQTLFHPWDRLGDLATAMVNLDDMPDDTPEAVRRKQERYHDLVKSSGYLFGHLWADSWCAAFVWPKVRERDGGLPYPITEHYFRAIEKNPYGVPHWMKDEVQHLAREYCFFHWHLEFPDVFRVPTFEEKPENEETAWSGGFDCVLGNPPWETLEFKEQEWFAGIRPDIAAASTESRKRLIQRLQKEDSALYEKYILALRNADGARVLIRNTSRYPLCAVGKINTFSIFAELKRSLLNQAGRVGCIVPSGIATDDTTKFFFQSLMDTGSLVSLYSFENEEFVFPAIHHATKFCLLTMAAPKSAVQRPTDFVFFARQVEHLAEKERHFTLTAEDIALLNPNTRTCPIFRYKQDAELTKYIYRHVPVLICEARDGQPETNPWGVSFRQGLFNMSTDSEWFRTKEQLEAERFALSGNVFTRGEDVYLPLYEGKMFWHFDHRFGTYEGQTEAQANQGKLPELTPEQHANPDFLPLPRYWVAEKEVKARVPKRPELLASALEMPEQWRNEAVIKALCYWAAGYWRKAGDEKQAKKLLAVVLAPSTADTQIDALNKWLLDEQCEKMQERFPLSEMDVKRMTAFPADPIPLAEELLERFSPHWFVAFRDVTSAVVLRTAVFSALPFLGVGHTAPLVFFESNEARDACAFLGCLNSLALDYCARQSVGGSHLTYSYLRQFPVLAPPDVANQAAWDARYSIERWCLGRVLEIVFTAWDHERFSRDSGNSFPPFCWDEARRFAIRCELDAAFFHLYLGHEADWKAKGSKELLAYFPTPRHAVQYIMDTFRILRERDESEYGTYRTKDTILAIYDEMARVSAENAAAVAAGRQPTGRYQTRLNPPPGPPCDVQGNFIPMAQWDHANWPSHIHRPKAIPVEHPTEVPVAAFAAMAYPANDADKAVCAAALAVVEESGAISSMEHLDAVLLATHPDWCKAFLDQSGQRALDAARHSAPRALFVGQDQSVRWKDCRDYLEKRDAVTVARTTKGQPISAGTALASAKSTLPTDVDGVVKCALAALGRVRELRKDLSSVPQHQRSILDAFEEQHRLCGLAA